MKECPRESEGILFMGFLLEGRTQGTLFPVTLEELIPAHPVCRVIEAFVGSWTWRFEHAVDQKAGLADPSQR